jgi:phospholipid/cholesterol/gamma-HCH transport system substrate-binding protein
MKVDRTVDLSVGIFIILGVLCLGYISVSFGNLNVLGGGQYQVEAVYSSVAGLNENTEVEMLGIRIGSVNQIWLEDYKAHVKLGIDRDVTIPKGSIASIKTEGLLGEKYVSISPGAMPGNIKKDGTGTIRQTNPPLILEDMISKMVFGSTGSSGE